MRIYVQSLTDAEKLELGRLLLKAGYCVRLGKERQGKAWRRYLEAEPCTKETAASSGKERSLTNDEAGLFGA